MATFDISSQTTPHHRLHRFAVFLIDSWEARIGGAILLVLLSVLGYDFDSPVRHTSDTQRGLDTQPPATADSAESPS